MPPATEKDAEKVVDEGAKEIENGTIPAEFESFINMTERDTPKLRARIYRMPVMGNLAYLAVCILLRMTVSIAMRISGFRKMKFGNLILWTPKDCSRTISDGLDFLRQQDEDEFNALTKERLVIYYSSGTPDSAQNLFPLDDVYVKWGPQAIAAFLIQTLLLYRLTGFQNPYRLKHDTVATIDSVPQQVVKWMTDHSVSKDFIKAYRAGTKQKGVRDD